MNEEAIDRARLFKELLTTFFVEFVEAFLPDVMAYLDTESIEFLDKEVFTDITEGKRYESDIVVKARFQGREACFPKWLQPGKRQIAFPGFVVNRFQFRVIQLNRLNWRDYLFIASPPTKLVVLWYALLLLPAPYLRVRLNRRRFSQPSFLAEPQMATF